METREYLEQVDRLDKMIQNKLSEIYQLKTMACSITVSTDMERVQSSGDKDRLGSTVVKIIELENEINDLIDELVDKKKVIVGQIESLEDTTHYHILMNRFVIHKSFDQIAREIPCSYRKATKDCADALVEFEKQFGHLYLDL